MLSINHKGIIILCQGIQICKQVTQVQLIFVFTV